MKSVMKHDFANLPSVSIPRSQFNRSHGWKTTFDAGYLIPFFVDEALPGDTHNLRTDGLVRLSTPLFPTMDNMFVETFYFAVPMRLIWDNWQKMMGEQENPGDSTDYVTPKMVPTAPQGYAELSLSDYLGIPTKQTGLEHNSFAHRAYNLIWNEWFRDQNLQDSVPVDKDDGVDLDTDYVLLRRGKRHDYFTSCLPWPQKTENPVFLPLSGEAPITGFGAGASTVFVESSAGTKMTGGTDETWLTSAASTDGLNAFYVQEDPDNAGYPNIYANLSVATSATINEFRQAMQIQRMYETDARSGTRYIEIIKAHFGVTSPDSRHQRPEFLGGGSTPIHITPVASTENTVTGKLAGFGQGVFQGHGFTKSFTEHCIIIGLVNARADITYQQGLNRMFSRDDRLDYYWPQLSSIGEQAVLRKEIYATGNAEDNELVFGYQERFAEYRYRPSQITGRFRSNATTSLEAWHLAEHYNSAPLLGAAWIQDNPEIDRIIRVTSEPHFIGDFYHNLICARPMPVHSIPGGIGKF